MTLGQNAQDDPSVVFSFLGGLRTPRWFLFFIEVLAGYSFVLGPASIPGLEPAPIASGPILDILVGAQLPNVLSCGIGVTVGPLARIGLGDGTGGWVYLGAQLGVRYDNLIRAAECGY